MWEKLQSGWANGGTILKISIKDTFKNKQTQETPWLSLAESNFLHSPTVCPWWNCTSANVKFTLRSNYFLIYWSHWNKFMFPGQMWSQNYLMWAWPSPYDADILSPILKVNILRFRDPVSGQAKIQTQTPGSPCIPHWHASSEHQCCLWDTYKLPWSFLFAVNYSIPTPGNHWSNLLSQ